ncbi:MAG TPA: hypothetical protein DD727_05895 [Clostridiales bacterium]|nr:hypothetical protein [Clostridiales bacterium]
MLNILNAHPEEAFTYEVDVLDGQVVKMEGRVLAEQDVTIYNTFEAPDRLKAARMEACSGNILTVPPMACMVVRMTTNRGKK